MLTLRPYQIDAINGLWDFFRARKHEKNIYNPLLVLPTGAGKSLVIAGIIKDMLEKFGGRRVLMLTHQKELIVQNFEKMMTIYPECEPGIYSASLGKRQTRNKVLFCGIQSVYNKAQELGDFSLILIDECHLLPKSGNGMYLKFIKDMRKFCGKVPVVGLTATPYRLDSGYLHKGEGALFTDIAHEIGIQELLDDGYLSPLTTKKTGIVIDASQVKKRGGEFLTEDLEKTVEAITEAALSDALPRIEARQSGLVFCVTVRHAEHVNDWMNEHGISCAVVSGETPQCERARLLQQFKSGHIRVLANVNVLTTGFDAPNTDFLIMLRPTLSPGLYVQMGGRGMRLADGKNDCLVLDYAGNIARHGPVDQITVKEKQDKGEGETPIKTCPECESIVHASLRVCACGHEFPPPKPKIDEYASNKAILSKDYTPEWHPVDRVTYSRWPGKDGKPDTMRVDYWDDTSGLWPVKIASEFVCVFHPVGWAREKAKKWCARVGLDIESFHMLLDVADKRDAGLGDFSPSRILLNTRGKFAQIVDYDFAPRKAHEAA